MKLAWMFPGQGSQSAGMARGLLRDFAPARALLEQAEQICGLPLNQIRQFGPTNELARPEVLEPLLTAVNIGYAMLLLDRHIEPDVVAGYSAGEVAALFASGVLSSEDALQAATIRGKQLSFAVSDQCKMVAVTRLSGEQILDAIHNANKTGGRNRWLECARSTDHSGAFARCARDGTHSDPLGW